jgi:hypothetical protein
MLKLMRKKKTGAIMSTPYPITIILKSELND